MNFCLILVFLPPSYFLTKEGYFDEIFKNDRKYISARRSGPLKFVFLIEKLFKTIFHAYLTIVEKDDRSAIYL